MKIILKFFQIMKRVKRQKSRGHSLIFLKSFSIYILHV